MTGRWHIFKPSLAPMGVERAALWESIREMAARSMRGECVVLPPDATFEIIRPQELRSFMARTSLGAGLVSR